MWGIVASRPNFMTQKTFWRPPPCPPPSFWGFYPLFYRQTSIILNYCCHLFNFPTQKAQNGQFGRTAKRPPVRRLWLLRPSCNPLAARCPRRGKYDYFSKFPRGGTPTVVAQTLLSPLLRLSTASPDVVKSQKSPISARRHAECGRSGSAQFKHTSSYT